MNELTKSDFIRHLKYKVSVFHLFIFLKGIWHIVRNVKQKGIDKIENLTDILPHSYLDLCENLRADLFR